jgi:hypothetical protein
MTMKRIASLTLTGTGNSDKMKRGDCVIPAGYALRGILAKFSVNLANASGGNITLSDTQKQSFFGGYSCTLSYGAKASRKPFNAIKLTALQRIARFMMGQDFEGYTNSTTGLGRSFTNGNTLNAVFWAYVPTSLIWHQEEIRTVLRAGRTQAKSFELEFSRDADTLPTGMTVSGNVSITIYPDTVVDPLDHWLYLPEYYQVNETAIIAKGPVGLHLLAAEDSAVLTSTSLTNIETRINGKALYSQVNPNDAYIPTLQVPNIPSEADTSDRWTLLYQWGKGVKFAELPVGALHVEQLTKDLTTFQLRGLVMPIVPSREQDEDIAWASGKNGRNKVVKAVNTAAALGLKELPEEHHAYVGFVLYDSDRPEFTRLPGKVGKGDEQPVEVYIPETVAENARAIIGQALVKGEGATAETPIRTVTLAIPGGVQDVEGLRKEGSPVLDQVRTFIAS